MRGESKRSVSPGEKLGEGIDFSVALNGIAIHDLIPLSHPSANLPALKIPRKGHQRCDFPHLGSPTSSVFIP